MLIVPIGAQSTALDERGRTARVAVELLGSLFGLQITDRPTPTNAVLPDNS